MKPLYTYLPPPPGGTPKVYLAPAWLIAKLEENDVCLSVVYNGELPNILSGDELIYYHNYGLPLANTSPAFRAIYDQAYTHNRHGSMETAMASTDALMVEINRLTKAYGSVEVAEHAMSLLGPGLDTSEPFDMHDVGMGFIEDGNNVIVTYGSVTDKTLSDTEVTSKVFEFYSAYYPANQLLTTSLYAYLVLGPAKYKSSLDY